MSTHGNEDDGAAARQELLRGLCAFGKDHGLDAETSGGTNSLTQKFLAVYANNVDIDTTYPLVAKDLNKVKFCGQEKYRAYRSTSAQTHTFSADMWHVLFSSAHVQLEAPEEMHTSPTGYRVEGRMIANPKLEVYRHFKRDAAPLLGVKVPEWKAALAFYLPSIKLRNAHEICEKILPGVRHTELNKVVRDNLAPEEYASGLGHLLKSIKFNAVDSPEFRMVLRDPRMLIERRDIQAARKAATEAASLHDVPVWERSETYVPPPESHPARLRPNAPAHRRIAAIVPEKLTFRAKKNYRNLPSVKSAMNELLKTGEHTPAVIAFRGILNEAYKNAPYPESGIDAHVATPDLGFQQVLSLLNFMPVQQVMDTTEMQDFLASVAGQVGRDEYNTWTDRDAVKRLLTVHADNWVSKWDPKWTLDEPTKRAVIAHRQQYQKPSQAVLTTVLEMEPIVN